MKTYAGLLASLIMMMGSIAYGAPGAGGATYIPWGTIAYQLLNIVVVIAGIIYFAKDPVREMFKQRRRDYQQAAEKAMQARAAAEAANQEIKDRLQRLEASADGSIEKSKIEAQLMKEKMIADAQEISARLERDSQRIIFAELDKARTALRNSMIDEAIVAAETALKTKMSDQEQQRLQGEFVEKIQVARS